MAKFNKIDGAQFNRLAVSAKRSKAPFATAVRFDRKSGMLKLKLNTRLEVSFAAKLAHGLENANDDQLANVELEGGGSSIYFPDLDADFTVSRLLEGFLGPMDWTRQVRRAEASRANGKLGGRPRKEEAKQRQLA